MSWVGPATPIILIGGIEATGQSGLVRDIAACVQMGMRPVAVPSCTTIEGDGAPLVQPTSLDMFCALLEAAVPVQRATGRAPGPVWAKVGAVPGPEHALALADWARGHGIRLVLDPVLGPSSGGAFCRPEDLAPLFAVAAVATPNEDEARAFGVADGPRVHVTRGGSVPGTHRGTGCRFATRLACLLALGLPPEEAVPLAHTLLEEELVHDVAEQRLEGERLALWTDSRRLLWCILSRLRFEHLPEVGMNFAYAMPGAQDPRTDVCGLAGRITIAGFSRAWTGRIAFGGPHHTGRMAVVLQEYDPAARIVLNHRFHPAFLEAARRNGLVDAGFSRMDEPADAPSSMEWGLRHAIAKAGRVPDLVWDEGGVGKEAMIRVIATDLDDMARKLDAMHDVREALADPDGRPVARASARGS